MILLTIVLVSARISPPDVICMMLGKTAGGESCGAGVWHRLDGHPRSLKMQNTICKILREFKGSSGKFI
jgi:hypothetical protein